MIATLASTGRLVLLLDASIKGSVVLAVAQLDDARNGVKSGFDHRSPEKKIRELVERFIEAGDDHPWDYRELEKQLRPYLEKLRKH